jgi:predicted nucleotidyltransferase
VAVSCGSFNGQNLWLWLPSCENFSGKEGERRRSGAMKNLQKAPLLHREREAVEVAVGKLKKAFPIDQAILFGSKARGDADAASDIDLLLLTPRDLHWTEEKAIVETLFDIGLIYDVIFSPLCVSTAEWESGVFRELPIYQEICRDGAVVS